MKYLPHSSPVETVATPAKFDLNPSKSCFNQLREMPGRRCQTKDSKKLGEQ